MNMDPIILLTVVTISAIVLPAAIYVVAIKLASALYWTVRANQSKERGEWLIEAMLHQAYREELGMRPTFLRWYLRAAVTVRTAWLMGAAATIAVYIIKWLPDWFVWPYWILAGMIIAMSLTIDAMKLKQWNSHMAGRYHPLQDLPFH